jgi:predicted Rossmann-fold nucleotide-binding protein
VRLIEIDSVEQLDHAVAAGADQMDGWVFQGVDLRGREDVLVGLGGAGALFLGCTMPEQAEDALRREGALIFPSVPDVPFEPYRSGLYTAEELYAGLDGGYESTPDARIYAWFRRVVSPGPGGVSVRDSLAMTLHDNSIDDALAEFAEDRRIVGVMGGHALQRGDPAYAAAARLGHELASGGVTVATGGGPGAMEAANLGARLAGEPVAVLDEAVRRIASVPSFRPSVTDWAAAAFAAVEGIEPSGRSLGIPTWFYGHEPPNPFCARVAKYFKNATREDVLLHLCRDGIVFLPGAAGTVQEIFQAACDNYYADEAHLAPMVLVGKEFWSRTLPAWDLLGVLAGSSPFATHLELVDGPDEVLAVLGDHLRGGPG